MSKYEKTALLFLFSGGQMYPLQSVYFHCHATNLLKQYLNETVHTCYKIYRYFNFQLCPYHLFSAVKWNIISRLFKQKCLCSSESIYNSIYSLEYL